MVANNISANWVTFPPEADPPAAEDLRKFALNNRRQNEVS